jgi:hypothetical protein
MSRAKWRASGNDILDYLAYHRHFFRRLNNIPAFNPNGDSTIHMRRLTKGASAGTTNIIVVHVGRPYFLEVKRFGAYQSAEQKAFQKRAEGAGAMYAVVRSIEDVQQLGL